MDTPETLDRRLEEAADWFEEKREGTINDKDFDRWMRDSRNLEAWLRVCRANEALQNVKGGVDLIRELRLGGKPAIPANDIHRPGSSTKTANYLRLAVAKLDRRKALYWLCGTAGSGLFAGFALLVNAKESAETTVGSQRVVTLPEGTILDLNTDTKVQWKITPRSREVWLERGEMALSVHQASQPFVLFDRGGPILLLNDGQINVRRLGSSLDVTVIAGGAVLPQQIQGVSMLSPGRLLVSKQDFSQVRTLSAPDTEKVVLWKQRLVSFNGETLAQAVDEFNRYLPSKIEIVDPKLNSIRLMATGNWRVDAPEEFLDSLSSSFDMAITRQPHGGYLISDRQKAL